ncbi:DUF4181 domain-containing protein [Halobacillus fulvus]|nr:DUF4181 domain-containing protein [Halobacillus fulvus]
MEFMVKCGGGDFVSQSIIMMIAFILAGLFVSFHFHDKWLRRRLRLPEQKWYERKNFVNSLHRRLALLLMIGGIGLLTVAFSQGWYGGYSVIIIFFAAIYAQDVLKVIMEYKYSEYKKRYLFTLSQMALASVWYGVAVISIIKLLV